MVLILVLLNIFCAVNIASLSSRNRVLVLEDNEPIEDIDTDVWIRKAGFESEAHNVVTEDGYILRLTRITTGASTKGPPVLIVHGFTGSSDIWVKRGRGKDMAFILADNGFDVWLPDLRGNVFSRKHKYINASDKKFWDFSVHEMGVYDLPALITKVLSHSTYPKLFYIGDSMGTTVFFVMASSLPQANNYIQTSLMLSPIVYPPKGNIKSHFSIYFKRSRQLYDYFNKKLHIYEIFPRSKKTQNFIRTFCSSSGLTLCLNFFGDVFGEHRTNLNVTELIEFSSTTFAGTSAKTLYHLIQIYHTDEFKQFDFGEKENLQNYGQRTPPFYRLELVSAPVALYYSDNDNLLDVQSVQKLAGQLPNVIYEVNIRNYSHIDFLLGFDVTTVLYDKILQLLINTETY